MRGETATRTGQQRRGGTGLRAMLATGLVAAALSLGIGLAVMGALAATATVAAGGLGLAYGACQTIESNLATDLGISVEALRTLDTPTVANQIAARQAAGGLTASGAQRASERGDAYATCRQTFAPPAASAASE